MLSEPLESLAAARRLALRHGHHRQPGFNAVAAAVPLPASALARVPAEGPGSESLQAAPLAGREAP